MPIQIASGFTMKAIGEIHPHGNNAKQHPRKKVRSVARSIEETGFNNPILVDRQGNIIAGHCRHLAAILLGMDQVPVVVLDHLTEGQIRLYRIADNRLAEIGSVWSKKLLSIELTEIVTSFPDLDLYSHRLRRWRNRASSEHHPRWWRSCSGGRLTSAAG